MRFSPSRNSLENNHSRDASPANSLQLSESGLKRTRQKRRRLVSDFDKRMSFSTTNYNMSILLHIKCKSSRSRLSTLPSPLSWIDPELKSRASVKINSVKSPSKVHLSTHLLEFSVLAYTILGFLFGLYLICNARYVYAIAYIPILAHTMVWSAYLHHELAHGHIFESKFLCDVFGNCVDWICGGCYFTFHELQQMHVLHHRKKVDFMAFDIIVYLQDCSRLTRDLLIGLEYFFIPSLHILVGWRQTLGAFWHPLRVHMFARTAAVIVVRWTVFLYMFVVNPLGALAYFVAYCLMIHMLRFTDCFSHTYELVTTGEEIPEFMKRNKNFDMQQTYSIVAEGVFGYLLNLVFLNFTYHNAHHWSTGLHWSTLPELDALLLEYKNPELPTFRLRFKDCFYKYCEARISRIFDHQGAPGTSDNGKYRTTEHFVGVLDASFLILEY